MSNPNRLMDGLASSKAKLVGDIAGLGILAGTTADRALDEDAGAGRETARSVGDVLGYGAIALPIAASALRKGPHRKSDLKDLASLGLLTAPAVDGLQANTRALVGGGSAEDKMIIPHKGHSALEIAGMGALGARTLKRNMGAPDIAELGGYAALTLPYAADFVSEDGHGPWDGSARASTDLVGLGLLAAGAMGHKH